MAYQIEIKETTAILNGKEFDFWPTMVADSMAERIAGDYFESLPEAEQPSEFSPVRSELHGQVLQAIIDHRGPRR